MQTSDNLTGFERLAVPQAMQITVPCGQRSLLRHVWTRCGSPLEPSSTAVDLHRLHFQAPPLDPSAARPDGTDAALAMRPARCLASSPTPPMNAEASLLRNGKPMK